MQKNQVKMVPKQVFTGGGNLMSIQEAPSCRVNLKLIGVTEKDLILHTQIISIINTFDFNDIHINPNLTYQR